MPCSDINSFRRDLAKQISSSDIWPLLVLFASCVFLADIFVRRVSISLAWLQPAWTKTKDFVLRREPLPVPDERMARLQSRKREIEGEIDDRRSIRRFEPEVDADTNVLEQEGVSPTNQRTTTSDQPGLTPDDVEAEDYTSRLLKAKRDATKDRTTDEQND